MTTGASVLNPSSCITGTSRWWWLGSICGGQWFGGQRNAERACLHMYIEIREIYAYVVYVYTFSCLRSGASVEADMFSRSCYVSVWFDTEQTLPIWSQRFR